MKNLTFLIIIISLCSCIKEIKVDHPRQKNLLTLNCVIRHGNPIRATLSSTLPFGSLGYSPYFKDGLMVLYENGTAVDTMEICEKAFLENSRDTAWYFCSAHPTSVGALYSVEASYPGFPKVIGKAKIPTKPVILNVESTEDDEFGDLFEIQVEDTDPSKSFYIFQMRNVNDMGTISSVQLTTSDPTLSIYQSYISFQLPTNEITGSTAYFTDKYFVNNKRIIKIRAITDNGTLANEIVLLSVSEEYYNYRRALEINNAARENPFTEPIRLKSNIARGFGVVGGENLNLFKF